MCVCVCVCFVIIFSYFQCRICEEIFDELLLDTALEIQSTVDSCVEQVFDAEFQCPAD